MQISEFNDLLDEYRLCLSMLNVCREVEELGFKNLKDVIII